VSYAGRGGAGCGSKPADVVQISAKASRSWTETMATFQVTEYEAAARAFSHSAGEQVPAGMEPAVAAQSFVFTTATASDPFGPRTRMVRFYSSVDCHVAFGSDPEATAESTPVTAKVGEFFGVAPGHKTSVYDGVS
jgi:hypothetical protein